MQTLRYRKFQQKIKPLALKIDHRRILRVAGFFEPTVKVDEDLPDDVYDITKSIEHIITAAYSNDSTDIIAIQTPPLVASENYQWKRYISLIYAAEAGLFVAAARMWLQHLHTKHIQPAIFDVLIDVSFESDYEKRSKQLVEGLWPLIYGLYKLYKEKGVEVDRSDPASIILFDEGKIISQGYHALREVGLNLEQKTLHPLPDKRISNSTT